MEFLLVNHPLDCPICDQGGECDLQVREASITLTIIFFSCVVALVIIVLFCLFYGGIHDE